MKYKHDLRCQCKKCKTSLSDFINQVRADGIQVIDSKDKQAVEDLFESLKKK